jgi:hypothetical protein
MTLPILIMQPSEITYIDEHTVGSRGCMTYRNADQYAAEAQWDWHQDERYVQRKRTRADTRTTEPLAPELRREAYFTWEQSSDLRAAAGSTTAMHPADWDRKAAAHWPGHPSIDALLASRGYGEDGSILG